MTPLELVVDGLATARITRLVTQDTITEPVRKRLVGWVLDRKDSTRGAHTPYTTQLLGVPADRPGGRLVPLDVEDVLDQWEKDQGRDSPKLATLAICPWCVGFYVAVAVAVLRTVRPRWWGRVAVPLALSQAAGVIDTH